MQGPEQSPQQHPRRPHGFRRGKSGNPAGRLSNAARQERIDAKAKELAAEFGGFDALSPVDRVLITQAAALVLRRPRSAEDIVRVANTVQRLLGGLGRRKRPPVVSDAARAYLTAAAAAEAEGDAP